MSTKENLHYVMACVKKFLILKVKIIFSRKKIMNRDGNSPRIVVSLTSIPNRFKTLYLTIEAIFRQTLTPDVVVLYLGDNTSTIKLPYRLRKLQKRGLVIKYVDDSKLGPHTKYFYALQEYNNDIVITFDDDILYDYTLVEDMYKTYLKYKKSIIAIRPHKIIFNDKNKIDLYSNWLFDYNGNDSLKPNKLLCQTGVGGVLYPPNIYPKSVFNDDLIDKLFRNNDDLYLYFFQIKNNIKVVRASKKQYVLHTIKGTQQSGLVNNNLYGNGNDEFIKRAVKYFKITKKDFEDN